jgi:hypothetical protein
MGTHEGFDTLDKLGVPARTAATAAAVCDHLASFEPVEIQASAPGPGPGQFLPFLTAPVAHITQVLTALLALNTKAHHALTVHARTKEP